MAMRKKAIGKAAVAKRAKASRAKAKPQAAVHEAVRHSRQRRLARDGGSANTIVQQDAKQLRDSARALCRDHDIARNAISILVQNTVGSGIDVMPAPRVKGGEVDRDLAQQLRDLWDEWWDRPEVTWRHDFGKCQQLIATSAYRDGEVFWQQLAGPVPYLDHGTSVPFSLEMLEADMVPLDLNDDVRNIMQGVERNTWGRFVAYHVFKKHPGEPGVGIRVDTKRVPADQVYQFAMIDRIHQVRGLSVFAPVVNRMRDIQDYEDSERIAAKVAASMCAQIVKGGPDTFVGADGSTVLPGGVAAATERAIRSLTMVPGMIADDLLPGERIEILDSKRPNPNVASYVDSQLRRAAGGLNVSFSSLSLNYSGTYSAQRQELVEKFGAYIMLGEQFIARVLRPIWAQFVQTAVLDGRIRKPAVMSLRELSSAIYIRPQMPWIDPLKEALARGEMEDRGWQAPQQNILLAGNDPEEVLRMRHAWLEQTKDLPTGGGQAGGSGEPSTDQNQGRRAALRAAAVSEATREAA